MPYIGPTPEQLAALEKHPHSGPIWMLNLLRFKDGGEATYQRYAEAVSPLIEKRGGKLVLRARGQATVIGPEEEQWDETIVVMYPSRAAFFDMLRSEEYAAIAHLRGDALVDSRLHFTTELATP